MDADPDLIALLRACKDEPEDDAPRLVLADWLEEHGEERRAGFIRRQVQQPTLPLESPDPAWLGAWSDWVGAQPADRSDLERVSFARGLIHISSNGPFQHTLRQLLRPPLDWAWVESVHCMCWSSEADWSPLLHSPQVQELSSLAISGDGSIRGLAEQFASAQPLPNLSDLYLSHVDLTDHGLATLCRTPTPRIRSLALSQNRITAKGLHAIANHPQFNRLRRLDLSINPIGNYGAKLLTRSWSRSTLRRLDLGNCHIEDSGMLQLASEEHLPNLEWLCLYGNRITDRGVQALLSLQRRRPLTVNLGKNPRISAAYQTELSRTLGESGWLTIGADDVSAGDPNT